MTQFLWICLGGAVGTGSRYLVGLWADRTLGAGFPMGTLLVNVLGSFLISFVMVLSVESATIPLPVRLFLTTGLLGGFTTYSAFNYETIRLFQSGAWEHASLNILVTLLSCAGAGVLGRSPRPGSPDRHSAPFSCQPRGAAGAWTRTLLQAPGTGDCDSVPWEDSCR